MLRPQPYPPPAPLVEENIPLPALRSQSEGPALPTSFDEDVPMEPAFVFPADVLANITKELGSLAPETFGGLVPEPLPDRTLLPCFFRVSYSHSLSPANSELVFTPFSRSVDLAVHPRLSLLICMGCNTAQVPTGLQTHLKEQHDLSHPKFVLELHSLVATYCLHTQAANVPLVPFHQAPVEGLRVLDGWHCSQPNCEYACHAESTFRDHRSKKHPHSQHIIAPIKCRVQTLFNPVPVRYFAVNELLAHVHHASAYRTFIDTVFPSLSQPPPMPSKSKHDEPPLLRSMGWVNHVGIFATDPGSRLELISDTEVPHKWEAFLEGLEPAIEFYYVTTVHCVENCDLLVRRCLLKYPVYVPCVLTVLLYSLISHSDTGHHSGWKAHLLDHTVKRYRDRVLALSCMVLRQITGNSRSKYLLPLSADTIQFGKQLLTALKRQSSPESLFDVVHSFLYSLASPGVKITGENRWQLTLRCYIAVTAIRAGGDFISADLLTPVLAKFEYFLRCVHFQEAYRLKGDYEDSLILYVLSSFALFHLLIPLFVRSTRAQCETHMSADSNNLFEMLSEDMAYATSIVNASSPPPRMSWSPDFSAVSYDATVLRMDDFRFGLHTMITNLEQLLNDVDPDGGRALDRFPFSLSDDYVENMAEASIGYSFLNNDSLNKAYQPLLRALIEHPTDPLGDIVAGEFHWRLGRCKQLLIHYADINKLLAVLLHVVPSQTARGTEFTDMRIRNNYNLRNVFLNYGFWYVMQRLKQSVLTDTYEWIPALIPPQLGKLLIWYLVMIRPIEILLAGVVYGFGSVAQSQLAEFLFAQMDRRMTSENLTSELRRQSQLHMNCELTIRSLRHMAIAMKREFIAPVYAHLYGDEIGDKAAGHSTARAQITYGRDTSSLGRVTSESFHNHRNFCIDWHSLLGFGPNCIPLALRQLEPLRPAPGAVGTSTGAPGSSSVDGPQLSVVIQSAVAAALTSFKTDFQAEIKQHVFSAFAEAVSSPFAPPHFRSAPSSLIHPPSVAAAPPFSDPLVVDTPMQDVVMSLSSPTLGPIVPPAPVFAAADLSVARDTALTAQLRTVRSDRQAEFKSLHQQEMIRAVMENKRNLVCILPTGGGKSLAWEFPAIIEPSGSVTLVICPFISLITHMVLAAKALGIYHTVFKGNDQMQRAQPDDPPPNILTLLAQNNPFWVPPPVNGTHEKLNPRVQLCFTIFDYLSSDWFKKSVDLFYLCLHFYSHA